MAVQETGESFALARKVGAEVRARRKAKRWTLKDLAGDCKTTPQTIAKLEKANMAFTLDWLEAIAKALGCEPADLMKGE